MSGHIQYVTAGIDPEGLFGLFIVLIIFITKVIQLMKRGTRQTPPPRPPPAQPIGRARSAGDELRSFLEELAGGQPPKPSAMPAQQTAAAPQGQTADRATALDRPVQGAAITPTPTHRPPPVPQAQKRVRRVARPVKPPPPIPKSAVRTAGVPLPAAMPTAMPGSGITRGGGSSGKGILGLLRNRESVQQAILLREILGEPIALRRPNTSTQPTGSPRKSPKRLPPEDDSLLLNLGHRLR